MGLALFCPNSQPIHELFSCIALEREGENILIGQLSLESQICMYGYLVLHPIQVPFPVQNKVRAKQFLFGPSY